MAYIFSYLKIKHMKQAPVASKGRANGIKVRYVCRPGQEGVCFCTVARSHFEAGSGGLCL